MKKKTINLSFPGQQTRTVTVYLKQNEQEAFSQLRLSLFEELNTSSRNNPDV